MELKKILIVCFEDTSLSVMIKAMLTQALYKLDLAHQFSIESAGLTSDESLIGVPATLNALGSMYEEGIDIHEHRSYFIGTLCPSLQRYDRIITTNQETLRCLLSNHNAPKTKTTLLFEKTGGIHLSSSADIYTYRQWVAQLKPEMRKIAETMAEQYELRS